MPVLNINGLDDPLLSDACPAFNGGQVSHAPPDQLEVNQFHDATNIDIKGRTARTRRGTMLLSDRGAGNRCQGIFWFDTPSREELIVATGGTLIYWNDLQWDGSVISGGYSGYTSANLVNSINFAQLIDKVYIVDGLNDLYNWDGATLTDEGTGAGNPVTAASLILSHMNRLWLSGVAATPDTLYTSTILVGGAGWDDTNLSIRIGGGEGDPITGLAALDNYQIAVFKRNSIYIVTANPADTDTSLADATVTKITESIGCVAARSIATVGNDIWFLSDTGVRSLNRVVAQQQREVSSPISEPVHDIMERINQQYRDRIAATFWDNKYMLSVPLDNDNEPSVVLVYDTLRQAWSGSWTGWQAGCFAISKANGQERLNFGRPDGNVWRYLDYVLESNEVSSTFQDGNTDQIPTEVTTRSMIFNEAFASKNAYRLELEFFKSEAVASCDVLLDEGSPQLVESEFDTAAGVLYLNFTLPAVLPLDGIKRRAFSLPSDYRFRGIQARVRSTSGKLSLRAVKANAFGNTVDTEA